MYSNRHIADSFLGEFLEMLTKYRSESVNDFQIACTCIFVIWIHLAELVSRPPGYLSNRVSDL